MRGIGKISAATASAAVLAILIAGCGGGGSGGGSSAPAASGPGGGFSPGTNPGGTNPGGTTPGGTIPPGTTFALVSSFRGDEIDVYDAALGTPSQNVLTTGGPTDLALDAARTTVYAPHLRTKSLKAYDATTFAPGATVDLSMAPLSQFPLLSLLDPVLRMAYAPTGAVEGAPGKTYVPAMFSVTVVEGGVARKGIVDLDLAGGSPTNIFDLLFASVESLGAFRAAAKPGRVYVTNFLSSTVTVIDTTIDDVVATIPVGRGPTGIAIDRNGIAYVACTLGGEVYTIDTATNLVGNTILTGVGPIDVACDPQNGFVYVSNYLSGDIAKIDGLTHQVVDTLAPSSMTSLMNALGLSPAAMQAMLNQMLAGLGGAGGTGGTSAGGLSSFLSLLLGGSGSSGSGGLVAGLMQQFLNTFFQQFGNLPGGGALPIAGIWGIGVSPAGDVVVVSNAVTGEVSFIDPATRAVKSHFPALTGGTLDIPILTSVEVIRR